MLEQLAASGSYCCDTVSTSAITTSVSSTFLATSAASVFSVSRWLRILYCIWGKKTPREVDLNVTTGWQRCSRITMFVQNVQKRNSLGNVDHPQSIQYHITAHFFFFFKCNKCYLLLARFLRISRKYGKLQLPGTRINLRIFNSYVILSLHMYVKARKQPKSKLDIFENKYLRKTICIQWDEFRLKQR